MSERAPYVAVALLAVALCALPVDAQGSRTLDSLAREVLRLDSIATVAGAEYRSLRAEQRRRGDWAEVRVGALTMRVDPRIEETVRAAARGAAALVDAHGDSLRRRVEGRLPIIALYELPGRFGTRRVIHVTFDTGRVRVNPLWSSGTTDDELSRQLGALVEAYALHPADPELTGWIGTGRMSLAPAPQAAWEDVHVEFATVESESVRRCRAGDAAGCLTSLGVLAAKTESLDAWYAPRDYRALLQGFVPPQRDSATLASAEQCRKTSDTDACARAIQAFRGGHAPPPLASDARQRFLEEVLRAGGEGAYGRLMMPAPSLQARLAAAASIPLDSVALRWRARVLAARPEETPVAPLFALSTIAWCGVFTAIGLTRRGTWR